ncbi:hypothetical protein Y1Q_0007436 [Alligator mississippiensis]|uniref:Uncharacterized protein n=1 Tax=Alligator mississippiensis TaxID=8496 RepID=A0A151P7T6_ALLMI|nr:hypothetical protein Y1Q_0007436 [Alligator mississippiensis]
MDNRLRSNIVLCLPGKGNTVTTEAVFLVAPREDCSPGMGIVPAKDTGSTQDLKQSPYLLPTEQLLPSRSLQASEETCLFPSAPHGSGCFSFLAAPLDSQSKPALQEVMSETAPQSLRTCPPQ